MAFCSVSAMKTKQGAMDDLLRWRDDSWRRVILKIKLESNSLNSILSRWPWLQFPLIASFARASMGHVCRLSTVPVYLNPAFCLIMKSATVPRKGAMERLIDASELPYIFFHSLSFPGLSHVSFKPFFHLSMCRVVEQSPYSGHTLHQLVVLAC